MASVPIRDLQQHPAFYKGRIFGNEIMYVKNDKELCIYVCV